MNTDWNAFAELYDWEFKQICTRQKEDVKLWNDLAEEIGGPIIELGCGSGRITKPLLKNGYQVTAIDSSQTMIDLLGSHPNLTPICTDMTSFTTDQIFRFAFIGYSSFQLLHTLEEQMLCLRNIRRHLEPGGILALDICPIVLDGEKADALRHVYTLPWEEKNVVVACYTSWEDDYVFKMRNWNDRYEIFHPGGDMEVMHNSITLKEIELDTMRLLLMLCGYELVDVYGSLQRGPLTTESHNMIIIAKRI